MPMPERVSSPFSRQAYGNPRTTLRPVPAFDPDETLPLVTKRPSQTQSVLPMKCLSCQGPVQRATAPVSVTRDGYRLTWDAVPAWVCTRCGSTYFEPSEVKKIRQAVQALQSVAPK